MRRASSRAAFSWTDFDISNGSGTGGQGASNASSGTTTTSTTSTSTGASCVGPNACVDLAPEGWSGPVAALRSTTPGACGDAWTSSDHPTGTPSGSVSCETCSCSGPVGGNCGAMIARGYADGACGNEIASTTLMGGCSALPRAERQGGPAVCEPWRLLRRSHGAAHAGADHLVRFDTALRQRGWPPVQRRFMPAARTARVRVPLCDPSGGRRVPRGLRVERRVLRRRLRHARCTPCGCNVNGAKCSSGAAAYTNPSCGSYFGVLDPGTCHNFGVQYYTMGGATFAPGSCVANGGVPMGAVALASPTTVCCAGP